MKKSFLSLIIISILCVNSFAQITAGQKLDPVGKWKFEAPAAPEGYTAGTLIFSLAENKYSAGVMFTNFEYKFPAENVKVINDSITFVVTLEGTAVNVKLKLEDALKMSGKSFYPEGAVPVSLTKISK